MYPSRFYRILMSYMALIRQKQSSWSGGVLLLRLVLLCGFVRAWIPSVMERRRGVRILQCTESGDANNVIDVEHWATFVASRLGQQVVRRLATSPTGERHTWKHQKEGDRQLALQDEFGRDYDSASESAAVEEQTVKSPEEQTVENPSGDNPAKVKVVIDEHEEGVMTASGEESPKPSVISLDFGKALPVIQKNVPPLRHPLLKKSS